MGAQGVEKRRVSAAMQSILSDVITTRALYTPLVYVFSRGWSVTSTAVRFHLRVLLCRPKYILARAALIHTPVVHGAWVATPKVS